MTDPFKSPAKRFADLLHHRTQSVAEGDPFAPPIVNASVYKVSGDPTGAHQYGRFANPSWDAVEAQLAILEDAHVIGFPSGMAAINAALQVTLTPNATLLLPSDGYYTTRLLTAETSGFQNITLHNLPIRDFDTASFEGVDVVFIETPSNPGLDMCDIGRVCARAHTAGAIVIADNTTMTPLLQRPLDLGADIVVSADTKAMAGHGDVVFGHVTTRSEELFQKLLNWRKLTGTIPGAFEAWLVHRGLETLDVRLDRMCTSAETLASRLAGHPALEAIRYPGLPDDPSHTLAAHQMDRFGFLIGLTFKSAEQAEAFLSSCPLIAESTSFGTVHTSGERRARWGGDDVPDGFVRLSIGCEPTDQLVEAIETALQRVSKA